jgi:hypothetical protein
VGGADRWSECPTCGRDRRLAGDVFAEHRRAIRIDGTTEMVLCFGSGTKPDSKVLDPDELYEPEDDSGLDQSPATPPH